MSTPLFAARLIAGAARLARGRADGITFFNASPRAFARSLLPAAALGALAALGSVGEVGAGAALRLVLAIAVAQLAPAVISHWIARALGREIAWLRYAVAMNWCQWAVPVAFLASWVVLAAIGLRGQQAASTALLAAGFYGLWLNWFVARTGLGLPSARAAAIVAASQLGTFTLLSLPTALG